MTDTAISPLRVRMIEDMTVRGFTASTQRGPWMRKKFPAGLPGNHTS